MRFRAFADRFDEFADDDIRISGQQEVHRRQSLVVHAPAAVQVRIGRDLYDLGADGLGAPDLLQDAGEIDPVEREHHVGLAQELGRVR